MEHDRIEWELQHAPSVKLLRGDNAPLVLSFLYRHFKHSHRVTIPYSELAEKLEDYLETLREHEPDRYPQTAQAYLKTWSDEAHRFLRVYYETGSDDPVVELTPDTERALRWLEEMQRTEFVGTESRFLRIFDLLEDIVDKSTEDVGARLRQLEKQKAEIERQIEQIRQTGEIETYTSTQIKERFWEAGDTARRLLADFREVEQNFRELARSIQQKRLQEGARKGDVVGFVLDAERALEESDQGRSFYTFWRFLMSETKQRELQELLELVRQVPELEPMQGEGRTLRRVKRDLIGAGHKIVQSNQLLAEQLRRLLDEQNLAEARRVQELVEEIKRVAATMSDAPPEIDDFLVLDEQPDVYLPMERPLWEPTETPNFDTEIVAGEVDLADVELGELYDPFWVDEQRLHEQVAAALEHQPQITLAELARWHPIQRGLTEVLAYLSLATHHPHHTIDPTQRERIPLRAPDDEAPVAYLTLPRVTFSRDGT